MAVHPLEEIFDPKSVAVAGASGNPMAPGYGFAEHLLGYGFKGNIYPVNPKYPELLGIKTYPTLRDIPGTVDYIICCLPSSEVLNMMDDCAEKKVKCIHFFTARFSETGRQEGAELEQEILRRAKKAGIRIIGPNCYGLFTPGVGISFGYGFPKEVGPVGMASQSGGGSTQLILLAALRGVTFSKVISYGNAIDLNECDYLDYFRQDPQTKIILMYIEGVKDGKRFFETLRQTTPIKPVIIVKGGRGKSGLQSVASHTASLAGSMTTWNAAVAQAGAIPVNNFDELADMAVSFYYLPPIKGDRVGIAGGGGGASVVGGDEAEEAGLDVIPLPNEIREELRNNDIAVWDWIGNPCDVSIGGGFNFSGVDMLHMMAKNPNFDFLIANVTEGGPWDKPGVIASRREEIQGYLDVKKKSDKPLLVVIEEKSLTMASHNHWRWKELSRSRTKLLAANIPVYPSMDRAARAAKKMIDYYQRTEK